MFVFFFAKFKKIKYIINSLENYEREIIGWSKNESIEKLAKIINYNFNLTKINQFLPFLHPLECCCWFNCQAIYIMLIYRRTMYLMM